MPLSQVSSLPISVTFEVSRPDRSTEIRREQSLNMRNVVAATTPSLIFAEVMESRKSYQGASFQYESSPLSAPSIGAIVRQPRASIIQRQVPQAVQSTIGLPDSAVCESALEAEPPSCGDASALVLIASSSTEPLPVLLSAGAERPSSACAFSKGRGKQIEKTRVRARTDCAVAFARGSALLIVAPCESWDGSRLPGSSKHSISLLC